MKKTNIKEGFFKPIIRYINYKVIIPMKREKRGPKYIARGTAIGIFFGLAPILWQMSCVALVWAIGRFFKWHFSLPIGLAWTWISNTVTNLPLLYFYYVIGNFLTGKGRPGGYKTFVAFFNDGLWNGIKMLAKDWGVSIIIGSAIVMITASVIGYFLAYRYAQMREKHKEAKRLKAEADAGNICEKSRTAGK